MPEGLILYTPDGYMSAQLSAADRPNFESDDMYKGKPQDYVAAGLSYLAYSGKVSELSRSTYWDFRSDGHSVPVRSSTLRGDVRRIDSHCELIYDAVPRRKKVLNESRI